jgi:hypothetical protein
MVQIYQHTDVAQLSIESRPLSRPQRIISIVYFLSSDILFRISHITVLQLQYQLGKLAATMATIVIQEWEHKGRSCCSPVGTGEYYLAS